MSDNEQQPNRRHDDPTISAIHERLDSGDARMTRLESALAENTALTQQIAANTAGFIAFQDDLVAGTKFMCRVAKGLQFFLKEVVDPYWKPALVVFCALYMLFHGGINDLPGWMLSLVKGLLG